MDLTPVHERLIRLLKRHTRPEDIDLSDRDTVKIVFERWAKYLSEPIVDVGE